MALAVGVVDVGHQIVNLCTIPYCRLARLQAIRQANSKLSRQLSHLISMLVQRIQWISKVRTFVESRR